MTLWILFLSQLLVSFQFLYARVNLFNDLKETNQQPTQKCGSCVGCCSPRPPICCDPSCPKCLEPIQYVRNNNTIGGIPSFHFTNTSISLPSWPFTDGGSYSFFPPPVPNPECLGGKCPCNNCVCCYTETLICRQTTTCTTESTLISTISDIIVVTSNINTVTTITSSFTFTVFDSVIISQNSVIVTSVTGTSTFFNVITSFVTGFSTLYASTISTFFQETGQTVSLVLSEIETIASVFSTTISATISTTLFPISITETLPFTIFTPILPTQTSFILDSFTNTQIASQTVTLVTTIIAGGNVMAGPV